MPDAHTDRENLSAIPELPPPPQRASPGSAAGRVAQMSPSEAVQPLTSVLPPSPPPLPVPPSALTSPLAPPIATIGDSKLPPVLGATHVATPATTFIDPPLRDAGAQPVSEPAPKAPGQRSRLVVLAGAVGAAVLIAAAILFVSLNPPSGGTSQTSPSVASAGAAAAAPVKAYLDAIVTGDAKAALKILPTTISGASDALLTDKVYAAATRPSSYTVKDPTTDGGITR